MSLTHIFEKIKRSWVLIWIALTVLIVCDLAYLYRKINESEGILYLPNYDKELINKEYKVYASKNGKTYYYLWCGGLNRIKKENRITFLNKNDAISSGLKKAKNCPGK